MRPGRQSKVSESPGVLLDTHTWIWLMVEDARLHHGARRKIEAAAISAAGIHISAISIWELGMLRARGRIRLDTTPLEWARRALTQPGVRLLPLSPEIALLSSELPGNFHGDPADRILVASSLLHHLVLVSADHLILTYGAAHHVRVLPA